MLKPNQRSERQVQRGPLTFFVSRETDDLANVIDWQHLGKLTIEPSVPYYDRAARVLVVNESRNDDGDDVYEAWYLTDDGTALPDKDYKHDDHQFGRHDYRYIDSFQYTVDAKGFDDCSEEIKQEVIAKHGGLREASIAYCLQDAKRLQALMDHEWWAEGVRVTMLIEDRFLGECSTWGIESDSEDSYFDEVTEGLISELLDELPEAIARTRLDVDTLRHQIAILEAADFSAGQPPSAP